MTSRVRAASADIDGTLDSMLSFGPTSVHREREKAHGAVVQGSYAVGGNPMHYENQDIEIHGLTRIFEIEETS